MTECRVGGKADAMGSKILLHTAAGFFTRPEVVGGILLCDGMRNGCGGGETRRPRGTASEHNSAYADREDAVGAATFARKHNRVPSVLCGKGLLTLSKPAP